MIFGGRGLFGGASAPEGVTPKPKLIGYQRLWPLASWATVDAGSSGVTYTEHADGIEWTIPAGPADVATPELAWRATGPVSAVVPQLAPAPTWWGLLAMLAVMERSAAALSSGTWVGLFLHPSNALGDAGAAGVGIEYSGDRRRLRTWIRATDGDWSTGSAIADAMRGAMTQRPEAYSVDSARTMVAQAVDAGGGLVGVARTDLTISGPWPQETEPRLTIAVGRVSEGASGSLRAAPQALLSISSLAQEGTP